YTTAARSGILPPSVALKVRHPSVYLASLVLQVFNPCSLSPIALSSLELGVRRLCLLSRASVAVCLPFTFARRSPFAFTRCSLFEFAFAFVSKPRCSASNSATNPRAPPSLELLSFVAANYRKRSAPIEEDEPQQSENNNESDDERERRMALEEIKLLQKQRERKSGIPANPSLQVQTEIGNGLAAKSAEKNDGDGGDKDELVLQDTFAQETAVMVEDPNMVKYIEQELAKKRGRKIDEADQVENELKRAEDELYKIPEHLKAKFRRKFYSVDYWYC
ncbi:hypothetical protein S245_066329, partial [Arachis hypogaea]